MPHSQNFLPSQHGIGGLGSQSGGGAPGTPTRQGHPMAPSVVISPSAGGNAPVSVPRLMRFSDWDSSCCLTIAEEDTKSNMLISTSTSLRLVLLKRCLGILHHQGRAERIRRLIG